MELHCSEMRSILLRVESGIERSLRLGVNRFALPWF